MRIDLAEAIIVTDLLSPISSESTSNGETSAKDVDGYHIAIKIGTQCAGEQATVLFIFNIKSPRLFRPRFCPFNIKESCSRMYIVR